MLCFGRCITWLEAACGCVSSARSCCFVCDRCFAADKCLDVCWADRSLMCCASDRKPAASVGNGRIWAAVHTCADLQVRTKDGA